MNPRTPVSACDYIFQKRSSTVWGVEMILFDQQEELLERVRNAHTFLGRLEKRRSGSGTKALTHLLRAEDFLNDPEKPESAMQHWKRLTKAQMELDDVHEAFKNIMLEMFRKRLEEQALRDLCLDGRLIFYESDRAIDILLASSTEEGELEAMSLILQLVDAIDQSTQELRLRRLRGVQADYKVCQKSHLLEVPGSQER